MKQFFFLLSSVLLLQLSASAQQQRWQQHADYEMDIKMDVKKHQYEGRQKLVYTNNSPESLDKVFYHLFFNAFQPGSMMDVRSRTIADPDPRVG
ncbi:MAG: M1 family peptidase, partial [Flavobacteriales bacterium]|nr:M1 family peptidase [Flavobacteriales bacterium]